MHVCIDVHVPIETARSFVSSDHGATRQRRFPVELASVSLPLSLVLVLAHSLALSLSRPLSMLIRF